MTVWKLFQQSVDKCKFWLGLNIALSLLWAFLEPMSAVYFSNIVAIIGRNPSEALSYVVWANFGILILFNVLQLFADAGDSYCLGICRALYQKYLYDKVFCHVHKHSATFLNYWQTGFVLTKVDNILSSFGKFFMYLSNFFPRVIMSYLTSAFILLRINIFLGVILILIQTVTIFIFYLNSKKIRKFSKISTAKTSQVTGMMVDSIANARLVKYMSAVFHERRLLSHIQNEAVRAQIKTSKESGQADFLSAFIELSAFVLGFLTLLCFYDLYDLDLRDIVLCATLLTRLNWLARMTAEEIYSFQDTFGTLEDAIELLWKPFDVVDAPQAKTLKLSSNGIEFRNVGFSYKADQPLFKKLNIFIEPNQKIGLVGVSGSGKSTLINLLLRAYNLQKGKILIDGQDIAKVTQFSLHQNIALISQEPCLFNRSVLDNIRYAKPTASMEEVIKSAKLAHIHDTIMNLPNGYDSIVGERGVKLSGGERQRVSMAAAILKDAPILILDEATSALDSESEIAIEKALKNVMKNKTVIAIAHRLSTLKNMDKIIVLEKGKISEYGTRSELLKNKSGIFSHLYKLQTDGYLNG